MNIDLTNIRAAVIAPDGVPAVVLPKSEYLRLAAADANLFTDEMVWGDWVNERTLCGVQCVVFGYEDTAYYDAGARDGSHALIRWCYAPNGFRFPSRLRERDVDEVGCVRRMESVCGGFVMVDPIDLRCKYLDIGVRGKRLSIRTYQYVPNVDAKFIIHIFSAEA